MVMRHTQSIINSLLLTVVLISCSANDARYKDTQMLERPPVLPVSNHAGEEAIEPDESVIPKKRKGTGLGSDVHMIESRPMQLIIKKPFDEAWRYLDQALKQSHVKVTDREQEKGIIYVYYKQKSLFESATRLFSKAKDDEPHEANYMLKLKEDNAETIIVATEVNAAEQSKRPAYDDTDTSDAEAMLWDLHEILRDELKEE